MGCLIILLILFSPRLLLFLYFLFNNARMHLVFGNSLIWAFVGFIFAPWTTLMYFWAFNPVVGHLTGWGWFWVVIGILLDLGSYGSTRFGRRSPAAEVVE